MSVGSEGAYDVILQDRITNPRTQLGLVLAYNEQDRTKQWVESRVPPLPPKQAEGALMWTHKDPITDFVFAQSDWSEGAFRPYYQELDKRYASPMVLTYDGRGWQPLGLVALALVAVSLLKARFNLTT